MRRVLGYLIVTFLFATVWVMAQVVLNEFQPGTAILSEDVNENFAVLAEAVATKQTRITGACPPGSSIRVVYPDGTTACETDDVADPGTGGDITEVNAGTGLTGGALSGPATLSLDTDFSDARYYPQQTVDDLLAANAATHGGLDPSKVTLVTEPNSVSSGLLGSSALSAECGVGQLAVGGGIFVSGLVDRSQIAFATSRPSPGNRQRWEGEVRWTSAATEDRTVFVYAVCIAP